MLTLRALRNLTTKILLGFLSAGVTSIKPSLAQNIVGDKTLGNASSQVAPNVNNKNGIPSTLIEGGAERGENLFHSFEEFNVSEGRGVYFLIPNDGIENVLTRVTGNNSSAINGILGTISNRNFDPTSANLFLINPNGIIFGKNSSLDLNGSFVGTTANAVEFGDQGFFSATNPQAPSELLTISPTAFLFNQINAQASIENNSVVDLRLNRRKDNFTPKGLRVADGESLLFVGGDINLDGGGLTAFGGRVELGGLASVGRVGLNTEGNNLSLSFPDGVERTNISLSNGAGVRVTTSRDGGSIAVNARNLEIIGDSFLIAGIETEQGSKQSRAGNIDINATGAILLQDSSDISNRVESKAKGQGGDVNISANTLQVEDETRIDSSTFGEGHGGNLTIDAIDVQVIGTTSSTPQSSGRVSALVTSAEQDSTGDAGDLTVKTNNLRVIDGARLDSSTFGEGKGGNLTIYASDVQVIGEKNGDVSTLAITAQRNSKKGTGELQIITNILHIIDGGLVDSTTSGGGDGGNITINAQDIQVIGSKNGRSSSLTAAAKEESIGDAGNLTIIAGKLQILDGAQVNASTRGKGDGGNLKIEAETLDIRNNSRIIAQSQATGKAGTININIQGDFNADNGRVITQAQQSSGGDIEITAKNIILRNNSDIKTTLSTTADSGGDINLSANAIVALEDSDILAFAPEGSGGNITFNTRAFLSDPLYRPTVKTADLETLNKLDGNNSVDVNASGLTQTGTISVGDDPSFLQDSLTELAQNLIDSQILIASSCVVRSKERNGTFFITGGGGFPYRPGDTLPSVYSAVAVQSITDDISQRKPGDRWKIGDPIVEPTGVYRLANGRRILSQECGK